MRTWACCVSLLLWPILAVAGVPERALEYLPILKVEAAGYWPDVPDVSALAGQVEQETCPSLTHWKCWNPRTELKTSREYGFGLGQITVTSRFNVFEEVKQLDASLKPWKWEDRYNPTMQLRALVLKDRYNYDRFTTASTDVDALQFALAAYNGGLGGTLNDIKLCRATRGCDAGRWFGNVEHTSRKSRTKYKGYGKSFFDINREYVSNILLIRKQKYQGFME